MKFSPSNSSLMLMPDGPIAFDGSNYRSSKGERLYFDNLAKDFRELIIVTFVLRKGDQGYESNLHSVFESENIKVIELPPQSSATPSVIGKLFQFGRVFFRLLVIVKHVDIGYLFLPSYPSALGWLSLKLWRKRHFVYGADDWVQASESMYKWKVKNDSLFYRAYLGLNKIMEKVITNK